VDKEAIVIPFRNLPEKPSVTRGDARAYIADMLEGLCEIAHTTKQNDLHALLKITQKAVEIANQPIDENIKR